MSAEQVYKKLWEIDRRKLLFAEKGREIRVFIEEGEEIKKSDKDVGSINRRIDK